MNTKEAREMEHDSFHEEMNRRKAIYNSVKTMKQLLKIFKAKINPTEEEIEVAKTLEANIQKGNQILDGWSWGKGE